MKTYATIAVTGNKAGPNGLFKNVLFYTITEHEDKIDLKIVFGQEFQGSQELIIEITSPSCVKEVTR